MKAAVIGFCLAGVLAIGVSHAAEDESDSIKERAAEEKRLLDLRAHCAKHDQIPATDMRSCIECPFGQHANASTGQCEAPPRRQEKR